MKVPESWLRAYANPPLSADEIAQALAMGGLDVEDVEAVGPPFEGVVVGEIVRVARHPNAERLTVCDVETGSRSVTIVCGAPNAAAGLKVPTALPGARLPGTTIGAVTVRGIQSHGMLCSAKELGMAEDASGLLELPADAEVGADVRAVLELDESLFVLKPTPNRGDCLSIVGIAREVTAVAGTPLVVPEVKPVRVAVTERLGVTLEAPQACPRYCGRMVRGVDARAATPGWMARRLQRSGIHPVSALVDITNYVMLELGQPLHAFDAAKLEGGMRVRFAKAHEKLTLLNGVEVPLTPDFLVIADERKPVALAGIMGGLDSAITETTRDVFLESAFFAPDAITGRTRVLGFGSDSAYRFERGVDFAATANALERATQLVLDICGGAAGPITEARAALPPREPVRLRLARAERVLGIRFDGARVSDILRRLRFEFTAAGGQFRVTPPSYRFDIAIEEDLIEELARIHGYDRIEPTLPAAPAAMLPVPETRRSAAAIRKLLAARDYQEIVCYSFVDAAWERDFCGNTHPLMLANPIASHMSVMRSSLAGGLIDRLLYNLARKHTRVRLFEIGRCFLADASGACEQPLRIGAVGYGHAWREQWGAPSRQLDFFDVKGDVEALLAPRGAQFTPAEHPALHPGRSAVILCAGKPAGWIGELHPRWQRKYDLPLSPVLFELEYEAASESGLPVSSEISRFPAVRRDIAVEVDEAARSQAVLDALNRAKAPFVSAIELFDMYRGHGVAKGKKSLAFRVLLQDTRKTLTDAEVESAVSQLRQVLREQFDAKLR
jgi:phenylalanyl-tRNA synthetase beta chain